MPLSAQHLMWLYELGREDWLKPTKLQNTEKSVHSSLHSSVQNGKWYINTQLLCWPHTIVKNTVPFLTFTKSVGNRSHTKSLKTCKHSCRMHIKWESNNNCLWFGWYSQWPQWKQEFGEGERMLKRFDPKTAPRDQESKDRNSKTS